eukprot:jgi/Bigna1/80778/fgenesh1_pg.74_\
MFLGIFFGRVITKYVAEKDIAARLRPARAWSCPTPRLHVSSEATLVSTVSSRKLRAQDQFPLGRWMAFWYCDKPCKTFSIRSDNKMQMFATPPLHVRQLRNSSQHHSLVGAGVGASSASTINQNDSVAGKAKGADGNDKSEKEQVAKIAFFHMVLYPTRAKDDKQLEDRYLGNLNAVLETLSPNIFYMFSVVGVDSMMTVEPLLKAKLETYGPERLSYSLTDESVAGDLCMHKNALERMGDDHIRDEKYDLFVFGNDGVVPVGIGADGEWTNSFRRLLASQDVVLAGPLISCGAMSPHVQSHLFAINKEGIQFLRNRKCYTSGNTPHEKLVWEEIRMSVEVLQDTLDLPSIFRHGHLFRKASICESLRKALCLSCPAGTLVMYGCCQI